MRIVLFTGGVRSGKSGAAVARARELGGDAVTFVATGAAGDDEMERRILRHRAERPAAWETLEAGERAAEAVRTASHPVVVLDCLTFLVARALEAGRTGDEEAALEACRGAVEALLGAAAARPGHLLVVTNEVGMGVVPPTPLGRWFRDAQGEANRRVGDAASEVVLLVSGIPLRVKG